MTRTTKRLKKHLDKPIVLRKRNGFIKMTKGEEQELNGIINLDKDEKQNPPSAWF